jgi:hypothetical protein
MNFLRIFLVGVAMFLLLNVAKADVELIDNYKADKNLKPYIQNTQIKAKSYDKKFLAQPIEYFVLDSLANAYSFYTNDQKPFVYEPETSTMAIIKRGWSNDNFGTNEDPTNTKNNLFILESYDWGQSWTEPTLVYNKADAAFGDARYPTIAPFALDGEINYLYIAPVTSGDGWNGFIAGFYIFGSASFYKVPEFQHNGTNYYWQTTSTKMIANTIDGQPVSLTLSTPSPLLEDRDGTNQSAMGFVKPNADLNIWNGFIPSQMDADKFQVVSEEMKSTYPPGSVNDYREFRYSSVVEVIELDGKVYSAVAGLLRDGNPQYRLTGAVSVSEDYGDTWSEFNICDYNVIQNYASSVGITKVDSISTSYDMVFNVIDENNYSFLTPLYENDENKADTDLVRQIVELYYNNGAWGVRKVADISGYVIVYPSSDPTQAPRNQMGVELQLSTTADRGTLFAKYVDLIDYEDPETGEITERGQHDVFVAKRKVGDTEWSGPFNVTNTPEYDRITWIPNYVPNDLMNIPLLKTYTIPQAGTTNDLNWQRELEEPQYVLMGYFNADDETSVNDTELNIDFEISNIYPNPANGKVAVNFNLPSNGLVDIAIYDVLGNKVSNVFNGFLNYGNRSVNFDVANLSSGIYYCSVTFNGQKTSKVMNVIK